MEIINGDRGPVIEYYEPAERRSDAAIIIFPGGGYEFLSDLEGKGYAEFFNELGMAAFVCYYSISPDRFPKELLDARRAVRLVRHNAAKYGVDPHKIGVIGSSAGGHLAAMLSTYVKPIEGEKTDDADLESFLPDAQILCYPVILPPETGFAHVGSYRNLLGDSPAVTPADVCPAYNVSPGTPKAFIWHTAADDAVNVINSYAYAKALKTCGVSTEMHIFPDGRHGLDLAKDFPHVAQWTALLKNWLIYIGWLS